MERVYVVPLRREALKCQRYKRTPRAMKALQAFISRHMKSEDVRIGPALNTAVWARGMRSPPPRVKVNCVKDAEGVVRVELFGAPMFSAPKAEDKKDKKEVAEEKVEVKEIKKAPEAKAKKPAEAKKPSAKKEATDKK